MEFGNSNITYITYILYPIDVEYIWTFFHHGELSRAEPGFRGQLEPSTGPLNWFFQWAFCSAAATIVSGGVAERVAYAPYVVFSFLMTAPRRFSRDV